MPYNVAFWEPVSDARMLVSDAMQGMLEGFFLRLVSSSSAPMEAGFFTLLGRLSCLLVPSVQGLEARLKPVSRARMDKIRAHFAPIHIVTVLPCDLVLTACWYGRRVCLHAFARKELLGSECWAWCPQC